MMSFKEFTKSLTKDGPQGELIKTIFISLAVSFAIFGMFYFFRLKYIENFIPKYGFYLFFAVLSYALILPSIRYVRAYKEFPCMSGMMAGLMGGLMGAMTAIMMFNDNLKAAAIVLYIVS